MAGMSEIQGPHSVVHERIVKAALAAKVADQTARDSNNPIVVFRPGEMVVFGNRTGRSLIFDNGSENIQDSIQVQFNNSAPWIIVPDPTIPQAGPDDDWVQMVDQE